jgi:uncharacterized protein (DUF362 family)
MDRRSFLKSAGAAAALPALHGCRPAEQAPARWAPEAFVKPARSRVAILPAASYDPALLVDAVRRGLELFGVPVGGRRVVLKPNLVEFDPRSVINTNPALIVAAAEAFRSLGAAQVTVAEGPGHRRDNEYLLTASGLRELLRDTESRWVDLNMDAVRKVALKSRFTSLDGLWLPDTVTGADLLVSMPKLKTHHWAGATLSMKNLFGIIPGSIYGWPKNVLHWQGIHQSILDINAALPVPRFNIVDGIVGMEGNGPIQGTARASGVLVFGEDPVAVDATGARLMGLEPARIPYIQQAGAFLGNPEEDRIEQIAEGLVEHAQDYAVIPSFEHLRPARLTSGS